MSFRSKTIRKGIEHIKARIGMDGLFREFGNDLPLRSEMFSMSQLEEHAQALAAWHEIAPKGGPDRLLARLSANETILREAYKLMLGAVEHNRQIVPAGEWLLDNYYLIEVQIATARRHLPKQYSRGLPQLLNGPSAGYPCVYDLALELISHVDGRIDAESLHGFIAAYQRGRELKIGELWAVPIMMRQALIENLRRVAARIATGLLDRNAASQWADTFIECAETSPKDLVLRLADMARPNPVLSTAFVAELARRLQGQSPSLTFPLTWVEQRLEENGQTIDQMVQTEGQQQAIDQVSIGNSINSLRELEAVDWREFVEGLSAVDLELRQDPANIYHQMDFGTRDLYRRRIESIALRSIRSEKEVAIRAVQFALRNKDENGIKDRKSHVGYFLVDEGLRTLERSCRMRRSPWSRIKRIASIFPLYFYVGCIGLLTIVLTLGVLSLTSTTSDSTGDLIGRVVAASLLLLGISHLSVGLVNWMVTILVNPSRLPRMDFSNAIPDEFCALVAVPAMLVSEKGVKRLLEGMEVRYLANRDANLRFCLLTDHRDAALQVLPEDAGLLALASSGIEALNAKYAGKTETGTDDDFSTDIFYLLHRPREWNSQEKVWMGHERKRGKLADLNALVMQGWTDAFSLIVGDPASLKNTKYVITLDTDTMLPRDAARELIATLAHPLNQAQIDERLNIVTKGYGILQPAVAVRLEKTRSTWFVQLFGGEPGLDPYTHTISDVYQDIFHEGSFIGKGIYDVAAFETTMKGRFLDNQILSHDLIEGCYARSGLVSDICLYETFPADYQADVSRRHRWIRGDWQIASWLLPSRENPITLVSRWKIFDNLRRSLVPFALTILLLYGWCSGYRSWLWTSVVIGTVMIPSVCVSLIAVFRNVIALPFVSHLRPVANTIICSLIQASLTIVFLPYEAFYSLDAVLRTVIRVGLTRKRLLEWKTASDAEGDQATDLTARIRTMWVAPALATCVTLILLIVRPETLVVAGPILWMWLLAPIIAWKISQPIQTSPTELNESQALFLHELSATTWRFFQKFVGPEDNWLPPDNFQEYPKPVLAHRTSPTNMGMSLLANLAAYDFGYLTSGQLLSRSTKTMNSMDLLERYHGHFLNWYDTVSLQPLYPKYVSSVDSGNLAGHLLTLRQGLLELQREKLVSPRLWDSIAVTLQICDRDLRRHHETSRALPVDNQKFRIAIDVLRRSVRRTDRFKPTVAKQLFQEIEAVTNAIGVECDSTPPSMVIALRELRQQCHESLVELNAIGLWLTHPAPPVGFWQSGTSDRVHRLGELHTALNELDNSPDLHDVARIPDDLIPKIDSLISDDLIPLMLQPEELAWLKQLRELLHAASLAAVERGRTILEVADRCNALADYEYDFLYDSRRRLLAIGFNVSERRRDNSFYDLLASESRLASFVGISQGRLPQEHWFGLGRALTTSHGQQALLSWSGSMFEYLMPLLVMPTFDNTLLDETNHAVVDRQIAFGHQRGVPWGVSESGYNATDADMNYQYRAFGVPGLGFKRGLADDLVIAPYATTMSLMVTPLKACLNLQVMANSGFLGPYGFYEAIDYTPSRLSRGQSHAIVRSYMAHHQGMSFLSIAYALLDRPMQRRFESDPQFRAAELLLQERIPRVIPYYPHTNEVSAERPPAGDRESLIRVFATPQTAVPEVHLVSNGRYHVMVTNGGGGYSIWKDLAVTRWREDSTRDHTGTFCYLRDVNSGDVWSTAHQPTLQPSDRYEAIFSQARAEFRRRDHQIKLHTEIAVSPEDDIEIRRTTLVNRSRISRTIELTSYAEVVLATPNSDATHPAFSNLFVQTEILDQRHAVVCTRRPRSHSEQPPWMLHMMVVRGTCDDSTSYETDRLKFIGRGRSTVNPDAMSHCRKLSNSQGSVLDPIVAIRRRVTLAPDESIVIDIVMGATDSRDAAIVLIDRYQDRHLADRVFDMAWTHAQVVLRQLNASEADAQLYGRLASSVVFASPARRASPVILAKNRRGQSGLWGYGISGDLPIVLLRISNPEKIELVRQLMQAHAFWRLKGLAVDLVIWNEDSTGYRQVLQDLVTGMITASAVSPSLDRPGGIFIRRPDQMADEDRILLQTVARVIITDTEGTLAEQIERRFRTDIKIAELVPARSVRRPDPVPAPTPSRSDLTFFNGLGGFTADGREYVIRLGAGQTTPAPWANVLANPYFGTLITESGSAYTWGQNAHEFRLTPWNNDPVTDTTGEAFYLRDEESGQFWSPTPQPARGSQPYLCRHGFGYTVFEYSEFGIASELTIYVANDAPVKFAVLKIKNSSGRSRRLSATAYCEWVLGELRPKTQMHVVTEIDSKCGALVARNHYSIEHSDRIAFFDVSDTSRSLTGDRTEFIGRNGNLSKPAAMSRIRLSGKLGAGLDPCAAMQVPFDLADNREREIVFMVGVGRDIDDVRTLVQRFRGLEAPRRSLEGVWTYWKHALGAVYVETPDPALNVLANGWLLYQTLSCRLWGRTGFYQSGGAFGFRDQLQDVAALLHAEPRLMREHLLLCARHQFSEGDVQHWWHPPLGRGVRTHISDDFLWLPWIACRYITGTGDTGILDEVVPFINGRAVKPEEDAYYDLPTRSTESGSFYDHCVRSIKHGFAYGEHGLPLIGSGDWNDGMNLVGEKGKGESIWLAFFLYKVLNDFSEIAQGRGDIAFAAQCAAEAEQLRENIEKHGWDGEWYLRAFFDSGDPLGSAANLECQIDSLPQSWSILTGAGDVDRSKMAMDAVYRRLVHRDGGLIQLFDPPFEHSELDPGYIKGYVPGVRENGGQYTHAAVWAVMAFAKAGDPSRAWELFSMINPVNHGSTSQKIAVYKVEPYVVAADVYAVPPHTGRGGWTWYTGSASWMYRLITESLLGLRLKVNKLDFTPCIPADWKSFTVHYRHHETSYHITIQQPVPANRVVQITVDGVIQSECFVALCNDHIPHQVEVVLGETEPSMSQESPNDLVRVV